MDEGNNVNELNSSPTEFKNENTVEVLIDDPTVEVNVENNADKFLVANDISETSDLSQEVPDSTNNVAFDENEMTQKYTAVETTPFVEPQPMDSEPPMVEEVKPLDTIPDQNINNGDMNSSFESLREPEKENTNSAPPKHEKFTSAPKYVGYKKRLFGYALVCCISLILFAVALISYLNVKTTSTFREKSGVNYQVCLNENEYYSNTCAEEEKEYVSAITNIIRADFKYDAVYQEKENRNAQYYIKSKLLIKTINEPEKELLSKETKLTDIKEINENSNVISVVETVDIPFQQYNDYAQKYKNDYSLLSNCQVIVSLIMINNNLEKEISSITIPLTKTTYNISKYELKEQEQEYFIESSKTEKAIFLGLVAVAAAVCIFTGAKLVKFLLATRVKESKYDKKLKQILSTYDRVIITLNDNNRILQENEIYTVNSFLELLDVRDTIDKPILYHKVNNVKTEFYVQDTNKVYKYTMKEADFEESNQGDI